MHPAGECKCGLVAFWFIFLWLPTVNLQERNSPLRIPDLHTLHKSVQLHCLGMSSCQYLITPVLLDPLNQHCQGVYLKAFSESEIDSDYSAMCKWRNPFFNPPLAISIAGWQPASMDRTRQIASRYSTLVFPTPECPEHCPNVSKPGQQQHYWEIPYSCVYLSPFTFPQGFPSSSVVEDIDHSVSEGLGLSRSKSQWFSV